MAEAMKKCYNYKTAEHNTTAQVSNHAAEITNGITGNEIRSKVLPLWVLNSKHVQVLDSRKKMGGKGGGEGREGWGRRREGRI